MRKSQGDMILSTTTESYLSLFLKRHGKQRVQTEKDGRPLGLTVALPVQHGSRAPRRAYVRGDQRIPRFYAVATRDSES